MKKRIISCMLAVCLLASLFVFSASAAEAADRVAELDLTQTTLATDDMTLSTSFRCNAADDGTGMTFAAGTAPDGTACWVMDCTNATNFTTLLITLNNSFFADYNGEALRMEVEYYSSNNIALQTEYNNSETAFVYAGEYVSTGTEGTDSWQTYTATIAEGLDPTAVALNPAYHRLTSGELSGHILLHTKHGGLATTYDKIYIRSIKVIWEDAPAAGNDDPAPTDPAPTETTPAPTDPAPTDPAPTETTPAPTESTPAPTESTPAPTESTPTEPTDAEQPDSLTWVLIIIGIAAVLSVVIIVVVKKRKA